MILRLERAKRDVAHRTIEKAYGLRKLLPIDVAAEGFRETRIDEALIELGCAEALLARSLEPIDDVFVLLLPERAGTGRARQNASKVDSVGGEVRRGPGIALGRRLRFEELRGGRQAQQCKSNDGDYFHARDRSQGRRRTQANRQASVH